MKFQDLYEKENKEHSAVSPGVQTLPVDQYMGAYKFSKDVAGHDGKKQHSPDASGSKVYTDKAIVVGYTDLEDKMTNAVLPKTKQTVAAGSEEPATVQKNSPLSKKSVKEAYQNDEANVFYKYDTADGKLKQRMVQNLDEPRARSAGYKETQEQALKAAGIMRSKFDPKKFVQNQNGKWVTVYPYGQQGVAEGAPELLKKEMPLHRHAEKLLAQNGVSKDDPDYYHHLGNTIKHLRQFGNIDLINKQGVAEGESNREIWDRVRSKGVVPGIDREKYTERPGLEGPFHTKSGKVVYYDKQEGKYYDPSTDFYISHDEWQAMNEDVSEAKGLAKKVKVVKGEHAGKTGWIREIKHGAFKGAPKTYYIDLDDGGQANNLPATSLRLVKDVEEGITADIRDYFANPGNDTSSPFRKKAMPPEDIQLIMLNMKQRQPVSKADQYRLADWLRRNQGTRTVYADVNESDMGEGVIYQLDKENPMSGTEVLVIGGAGRYSLDGLRAKARKEVAELAKDLEIEHGGAFRRSAQNIKQLQNTLNTIVAAYDELNQIRKLGGMRSKGIKDEDAILIKESMDLIKKALTRS